MRPVRLPGRGPSGRFAPMRRSLLAGLAVAVAVALGGGYVGPATAAASSGTAAELNFLQEGSEFSGVVAHFDLTTGQPNSTNPVTIDWGDGTTPTGGTVKQTATSSYDVSGTHTYAEEGNYLFVVTLHTSEGDVQTFGGAHVIDPAPMVTGVPVDVVRGTPLTNQRVATFIDFDPGGTVSDYSTTIDWGDGTSSAG